MNKKKKINYDLLEQVGETAPVTEKEDNKESPKTPIKEKEPTKKPPKAGELKQKLIFIPKEWEEAIKASYGTKFSISSYIVQAVRDKLNNDKII